MWIAQDRNGRVYLYNTKPHKDERSGEWSTDDYGYMAKIDVNKLSKSINPQWSDSEPIEVKIVRKNK